MLRVAVRDSGGGYNTPSRLHRLGGRQQQVTAAAAVVPTPGKDCCITAPLSGATGTRHEFLTEYRAGRGNVCGPTFSRGSFHQGSSSAAQRQASDGTHADYPPYRVGQRHQCNAMAALAAMAADPGAPHSTSTTAECGAPPPQSPTAAPVARWCWCPRAGGDNGTQPSQAVHRGAQRLRTRGEASGEGGAP
jgi:hypothetical protein